MTLQRKITEIWLIIRQSTSHENPLSQLASKHEAISIFCGKAATFSFPEKILPI